MTMAESGSIKVQLEKVTADLEEEMTLWGKDRLPSAAEMFRMGDGEFQHHCHTEALTRIVREILDVSEDQMNLIYKEVVLREMRTLRKAAALARRQAMREHITKGVINKTPPPEI